MPFALHVLNRWAGATSLVSLFLGLGALGSPGAARAGDYCIFSKVHVSDEEVVESTTIFRAGRVYDFLGKDGEITIFDPPGERFVLLDPQRKIKTEISTSELERFAVRLKSEAKARQVPLLVFLAEPKFEESFDADQLLTLTSPWLKYEVESSPVPNAENLQQYVDHSNAQAKLGALMKPGSLPPFARIVLNEHLEQHQCLPTKVTLTRYAQQISHKPVSFVAEHRLQWRLLESDRARLESADRHLHTFKNVSPDDYRRQQTAAVKEANVVID